MEEEMRQAEDLIKLRKEHAEKKALGSKRYYTHVISLLFIQIV